MIAPSKARLFSPRSLAFGMPRGRCDNGLNPDTIDAAHVAAPA